MNKVLKDIDKLMQEIGFERQKCKSVDKNRFYIFKKDLNCIKVLTDHESSNIIKNYEFPVISKVIKELWSVES